MAQPPPHHPGGGGTNYVSLVQQIFVDSLNFIIHTCKIKNKKIYHYSLPNKTVKLHQLSTSFKVNLEVCLNGFCK